MSDIITAPVARLSRHAPSARTGALAVAAAAAATLAAWVVAGRFSALDVRLSPGGSAEHVGAATVIAVTILAGLAAWATRALLARLIPGHARTTWLVLAIATVILSLAGPFGAGTTAATKAALACMHLLAAAILIPVFAGGQLPRATSARMASGRTTGRSEAIDEAQRITEEV
jgi:hypothetical protein